MKSAKTLYLGIIGIFAIIWAVMLMSYFAVKLISPVNETAGIGDPDSALTAHARQTAVSGQMAQKHRRYADFLNGLKEGIDPGQYPYLRERNIFERKTRRVEAVPFELLSVKRLQLPVIFSGYITKSDGSTVVQMNLKNETHFVSEGDVFDSYRVRRIEEEHITLENNGKLINLQYNKAYQTENFVAVLYDSAAKCKMAARKGEYVGSFEVTEIDDKGIKIRKGDKTFVLTAEEGGI